VSTIVKVQRPLNPPEGPWLVYGQGKQNMRMVPDAKVPGSVRAAMKGHAKAYFRATWDRARGMWIVGERVTPQDW
jgi:hypothetical protein